MVVSYTKAQHFLCKASNKHHCLTTKTIKMSTAVIAVSVEPTIQIQCKAKLSEDEEMNKSEEGEEVAVQEEEDAYRANLESFLFKKNDLVIDFSSLKTCLDPMGEPNEEHRTDTEFDYTTFVYETFDKQHDKMTSLQNLVLRKIPTIKPTAPVVQWDNYAQFYHGITQLSSLTELDISGNKIPVDLQSSIQLWNMQNLKKLQMDDTGLQTFPASVGRLRKLEELSLSKNQLKDLPVTLQFCKKLRVLNIQRNNFRQIPGVVLHLDSLQELRRLDNPLTARYNMSAPNFTRAHTKTQQGPVLLKFNPHSLQTLCTKTVFSAQVDYWQQTIIGPLQCKTLDSLAATFSLCEHCKQAIPNPGEYTVETLLITYLELSGVAFLLNVCSKSCQDKVVEEYGKKNQQLQKEQDEKYEKSIKEALRLAKHNDTDISPETINAPEGQVQPFVAQWPRGVPRNVTRRRRRKCAIM